MVPARARVSFTVLGWTIPKMNEAVPWISAGHEPTTSPYLCLPRLRPRGRAAEGRHSHSLPRRQTGTGNHAMRPAGERCRCVCRGVPGLPCSSGRLWPEAGVVPALVLGQPTALALPRPMSLTHPLVTSQLRSSARSADPPSLEGLVCQHLGCLGSKSHASNFTTHTCHLGSSV